MAMRMELEEKGLKLSIMGGKEGQSKVIAPRSYLEDKFPECSNGVGHTNSVETVGVDLRTATKQLGAKEMARRKRCDVRFSMARVNRVFSRIQ